MPTSTALRVLGLGNDERHDDGAGLEVARRVATLGLPGVETVVGVPDVSALVDQLSGYRPVFVTDAIRSGSEPGTVLRWTRESGRPLPRVPSTSTHGLSLPEALGLVEALGAPVAPLVVYGIEALDLSPGRGLSPPVVAGIAEATHRLASELGGGTRRAREEELRA